MTQSSVSPLRRELVDETALRSSIGVMNKRSTQYGHTPTDEGEPDDDLHDLMEFEEFSKMTGVARIQVAVRMRPMVPAEEESGQLHLGRKV